MTRSVEARFHLLDLFSGIGGFSLGLERVGFKTVAFCEIERYCRAVLKKHWPDVPCYSDVRELNADRLARDGIVADFICGGFPCQDISLAGDGAGLAGKRSGLWSEFHRLIEELQPKGALIENVSALRSRGLEVVLGQLASIGYDAEWHCIPASAVGASHQRDRVWIIAYPQGKRVERLWPEGFEVARALAEPLLPVRDRDGQWEVEPDLRRTTDGIPGWMDRLKCVGNSIVPQIAEIIGREIMRTAP